MIEPEKGRIKGPSWLILDGRVCVRERLSGAKVLSRHGNTSKNDFPVLILLDEVGGSPGAFQVP